MPKKAVRTKIRGTIKASKLPKDDFHKKITDVIPDGQKDIPEEHIEILTNIVQDLDNLSDKLFAVNESDDVYKIKPKTNKVPEINLDAAFEEFDDPYANYCSRKGITPKSAYSAISASVVDTPQCLLSPGSPDYVPNEVRIRRREEMLQGHNDAKEILRKSGFDLNSYMNNVFSAKKSATKSFQCSTPKNGTGNAVSTPVNSCKNKTPFSGVRALVQTPCSNDSPLCVSPITPAYKSCDPPQGATPFNWSCVSPQRTLATDIKNTLLAGFVCYVDVRVDKANMTESISDELLSLGAQVEKNFTKKVTIVVFKEGRVSTYLKAKKSNIPLVSVLWIEDCKRTCTVIDPCNYRPMRMERYDDILPFETIKKRRIPRLRTLGAAVSISCVKKGSNDANFKSSNNKISRKAVTEVKNPSSWPKDMNMQRHCNKKLNFNVETPKTQNDSCLQCVIIDSTDSQKIESARTNRCSSEKRKNRSDGKNDEALPCEVGTTRKRRKLFNPGISYLSQPLGTPVASEDERTCSSSGSSYYPSSVGTAAKNTRGVRTRLTSGRMKNKKLLVRPMKSQDKLLARLTEHDEEEPFRSCSRRSSMAFADLKKKDNGIAKYSPTIVLTRFPRDKFAEVESAVKELGNFVIESNVSSRTTHLVTVEALRTLNMVKAIARGCWILHADWIFDSKAAGKWLNEERYELIDFSPAVVHCRLERQAFGKDFCLDLFSNCGGIYICQNTKPPWKELESLVRLCGGSVVTQARAASIVVRGQDKQSNSGKLRRRSVIGVGNGETYTAVVVTEKWLLDSITQNSTMDKAQYIFHDPS